MVRLESVVVQLVVVRLQSRPVVGLGYWLESVVAQLAVERLQSRPVVELDYMFE